MWHSPWIVLPKSIVWPLVVSIIWTQGGDVLAIVLVSVVWVIQVVTVEIPAVVRIVHGIVSGTIGVIPWVIAGIVS